MKQFKIITKIIDKDETIRGDRMIYTTGDTHANQYKWAEQIDAVLSPTDIILVCGDFGIGFWSGRYWSEETFYDFLSEQKYTVLFIDGNHENFDKLYSYPVEIWCGGKVHKIRHNIIHLMRGEIYCIDDHSIFVMGGGYSIDKYYRKEGITWWPQEMPSEEEYTNALENLRKVDFKVDYIITHTAPSETVCYLSILRSLGIKKDAVQEQPLTSFLDEIQRTVTYKHWYFGHFHADLELWRNQTAILSCVRELETGKVVRQWASYEG